MNAQGIIGQISNQIVKGSVGTHMQQQDAGPRSQLGISELIRLSIKKNMPPPLISADALDNAMYRSIKRYTEGQFFLPDLIVRANKTTKARRVLAKYASETVSFNKGKAVIATLYGEDHSHWRNMVAYILKGLGFKTINLGSGASIKKIVRSVKNEEPDLLGVTLPSASIVPEINASSSIYSSSDIKEVINKLPTEGVSKDLRIMVGGHVTGFESAEEIGADYICKNMYQTITFLSKLYCPSN